MLCLDYYFCCSYLLIINFNAKITFLLGFEKFSLVFYETLYYADIG